MEELKDFLKVLLGFGVVALCIWLYLKFLAYLRERGWSAGRFDPGSEPPKVEVQTIFHGNTEDQDQI
jgi:hypothetical protein